LLQKFHEPARDPPRMTNHVKQNCAAVPNDHNFDRASAARELRHRIETASRKNFGISIERAMVEKAMIGDDKDVGCRPPA